MRKYARALAASFPLLLCACLPGCGAPEIDSDTGTGGHAAQALSGPLTASPSALAFGDVCLGQSKRLRTVLTNSGAVPLHLSRVYVDTPDLIDDPQLKPLIMQSGAKLDLDIVYSPRTEGKVTATATIVLQVDPDWVLPLSGSGVDNPDFCPK